MIFILGEVDFSPEVVCFYFVCLVAGFWYACFFLMFLFFILFQWFTIMLACVALCFSV